MRIHVLGSCGAYPSGGRACSGYLIEESGTKVLLDLGAGSFANLMNLVSPEEVNAIVLTHLHPDHYSDIFVFGNFLRFGVEKAEPIPLFIPYEVDPGWPNCFEIEVVRKEHIRKVGPLTLSFLKVIHTNESFAVRVEIGGESLSYSGDAKYSEELERFVSRSRLFLSEASFGAEEVPNGMNHLNAEGAARLARAARVHKLMITHIYPKFDEEAALLLASKVFGGEVILAREGLIEEVM